jgi:hypothetical protein
MFRILTVVVSQLIRVAVGIARPVYVTARLLLLLADYRDSVMHVIDLSER